MASYLAHDLGVDWRRGADWFESRLLDYDVCSNWGNWVSAAGLAPGRAARFDVVRQVRVLPTRIRSDYKRQPRQGP